MPPRLFCFGFGFTAREILRQNPDWQVWGTKRNPETDQDHVLSNVSLVKFDGHDPVPDFGMIAESITHILLSIPPTDQGDPVFHAMGEQIAALPNLKWVGYLSTTGVYGNLDGGMATEDMMYKPSGIRGQRRVDAEQAWMSLFKAKGLPLHIFRLPGIYGPNRNQLESLLKGKAHRIVKEGHVFSRIHVEDLARVLVASMKQPNPGSIYNVTDDKAAPPQDVVTFAAKLLNMEPPPCQDFKSADLSPMARSFYSDNKRVSNARIKAEFGISLRYPTYKEGLEALSQEV